MCRGLHVLLKGNSIGPQSLCIDGEATYTATSVSGTSYAWTIDDVEVVGETTSNLTVDWTGYSTGAHRT